MITNEQNIWINISQKKTCIINLQGNAKLQPLWGITSHLLEWLLSKRQKVQVLMRMQRKGNTYHWWKCKLASKTVQTFLKKLEIEPRYYPVISLLGKYLKELTSMYQRHTCPLVFFAVLFTTAKTYVQCLMHG